jgi:hypothetical protein
MYGNQLFLNTAVIASTDVAVYNESIVGNPLGAKHVVRYILSPYFRHNEKFYGPTDYLLTYCNCLEHITGGKRLSPPVQEPFFRNEGLPRLARETNCYWVGKGNSRKDANGIPCGRYDPPELIDTKQRMAKDGVREITFGDPPTREGLAELLNKTRIFYTFDPMSATNEEAAACGCNVQLLSLDGKPLPYNPVITTTDKWQEQLDVFLSDMENLTRRISL